jgi:hypothetical protein
MEIRYERLEPTESCPIRYRVFGDGQLLGTIEKGMDRLTIKIPGTRLVKQGRSGYSCSDCRAAGAE